MTKELRDGPNGLRSTRFWPIFQKHLYLAK